MWWRSVSPIGAWLEIVYCSGLSNVSNGNNKMNWIRRSTFYGLLLMTAVVLAGCSSQAPQPQQPVFNTHSDKLLKANDVLFAALGQVGIPYRYGGSTPDDGFDCSGLIQYVYAESANLKLPRTVAQMSRIQAPTIEESNLKAGDLVIFATGSGTRPSHAGIYVGQGRFVHAPSRGGVVRMDFLSEDYWQRSYLNAIRPLAALTR
jgi:cell wall-associated NlpC family hydrolase